MCSHLYVCVASINNLRQGCRPVNKRWHSQRERMGVGGRRAKHGQHVNTKYIAESCCESVMDIGIKVQRVFLLL